MFFGPSSITNTSLMKLWNSPTALNNSGKIVGEGQHGQTSIAFAECFDDIKCLIVFGIKYPGGKSKLVSFDQSTGNAFTPSDPRYVYLKSNFWAFLLVLETILSTDTLPRLFVNIFVKSFVINQSSQSFCLLNLSASLFFFLRIHQTFRSILCFEDTLFIFNAGSWSLGLLLSFLLIKLQA